MYPGGLAQETEKFGVMISVVALPKVALSDPPAFLERMDLIH